MTEYVTVDTPQGPVRFPKGMSRAEMAEALNKWIASQPAEEPKGILQTLKENIVGDNDPTTQNFGEKVGSTLNKAGEAMTFGLIGDEASAAVESVIPGVSYEDRLKHYRDQEAVLERDNPKIALAADIGGAVVGALAPGGTIGTLSRAAPMWAKMVGSGVAGAGMGGTYGFMEGEGAQDRGQGAQSGALLGGAVGAGAPVVASGVQRVVDSLGLSRQMKQLARQTPDLEAAKRAAAAQQEALRRSNIQIKQPAFDRTRENIVRALREETLYSPRPGAQRAMPQTSGLVDDMARASDEMAQGQNAAIPFGEMIGFRRQAGGAAGNWPTPTDMPGGSVARRTIDEAVEGLTPDDVIGGDPSMLASALRRANKVYSQFKKAETLEDAIRGAEAYDAGFSRGIKAKVRSLLRSKKGRAQFSEEELALLNRVANGSISERVLDTIGSKLTGIGGTVGGVLSTPVGGLPALATGAAVTGGSVAARSAANAVAKRNAEIVQSLILGGNAGRLQLPQSQATQMLIESLARRGAAAVPQ